MAVPSPTTPLLSALRTSLLLLSHSKIVPLSGPTWFRLATPLNLISATTETCVFLYIGWRLLFLHSSAGFGFSYSGLYLNSIVSVLSVFVQFALFCIRTYATKLCESLQPASSWGHQNVPNPFCAHDAPPDPLVGWGGDTPPLTPPLDAFSVSISAPLAPVWFAPTYFSFPRPCHP